MSLPSIFVPLYSPSWSSMVIKSVLKKYISIQLAKLLQTLMGFSVQHSFLKLQEVSHISHKAQQCPKCHLIDSDHVLESSVSSDELDSDSLWLGHCLVYVYRWFLLTVLIIFIFQHISGKGLNQNGAKCNRMLVMQLLELPSDAVPLTMLYWAIGSPLLSGHHQVCLADISRCSGVMPPLKESRVQQSKG